MGVHVVVLEDFECVLTVLDTPEVGIRLIEFAKLLVACLASEALLVEALLIGVKGGEEATQVGDILTECALAVAEEQRISLGVKLQQVVGADKGFAALIEIHPVSHRPPVLALSILVPLGTIVVEAVGELVANDGKDGIGAGLADIA